MACSVFEGAVIIGNPPRGNYIFPPSLLFPQQMSKQMSNYHFLVLKMKLGILSDRDDNGFEKA